MPKNNRNKNDPYSWTLTNILIKIMPFIQSHVVSFKLMMQTKVFQDQKTSQAQNLSRDNATQEDKSTFKNITFKEHPLNTGMQVWID